MSIPAPATRDPTTRPPRRPAARRDARLERLIRSEALAFGKVRRTERPPAA